MTKIKKIQDFLSEQGYYIRKSRKYPFSYKGRRGRGGGGGVLINQHNTEITPTVHAITRIHIYNIGLRE